MKTGLRRKWLVMLVASFVFCGVAFAGLPLALLIEPAASFVGGLLLRTAAKETVVAIGVAANDASWIVPLSNLVARTVSVLKIAGLTFSYELPMQPDVAIPATPIVPPASGESGSYSNPFPYTKMGLRVNLTGNGCDVAAWQSVDGLAHLLQRGIYASYADLFAACQANLNYVGPSNPRDLPDTYVDHGTPTAAGSVYVQGVDMAFWVYTDGTSWSNDFTLRSGVHFFPVLSELADGVKRFVRSAAGFAIDAADPDWTAQEKATFASPAAVRFVDAAGQIVQVAASATATKIQAVSQTGADVRVRQAELTSTAVLAGANETVITNATAADVAASSVGELAGNANSITLPTDYARAGEASTAAEKIVQALDSPGVATVGTPWKDIQEPDFDGPKDTLENMSDPDLPWQNLLPNFMPGTPVSCHPIEITMFAPTSSGISASGTQEVDLCSFFEIVRMFFGYLFQITTAMYLWRTFTSSQSWEK